MQDRVLAAMSLYSGGLLFPSVEHRLLHALVAVEALLLKSTSEPILTGLVYRVAHLVGKSVDERRTIMSDFKDGYDIRSGFVHHGKAAADESIDLVNRVVQHCWVLVLSR
jgi:hypothetical protein